jgi:DNA invertase Pin-like site-specific DNA recombinase
MVFRMLAVLAEFERDLVSERTTAALAHLKSQGRRVGEIPFGYRLAPDGEHLEPDSGEQATLSALRQLRGRGLTLRQVADTLNRDGATTKKGRPWTWRNVQNAAQ